MAEPILLNHHSGSVIPYCEIGREVFLIFEQKSPDFNPPWFDNGLCLLGGNWQKGTFKDTSPDETLKRELEEELWGRYEAPEDLTKLLGQQIVERKPRVTERYGPKDIQKIREVAEIILGESRRVDDCIVHMFPPAYKRDLVQGASFFVAPLSEGQFRTIESILQEYEGVLTTDNLRFDGKTAITTMDKINKTAHKFAYGNDNVMNHLIDIEAVPIKTRVKRTIGDLVQVTSMNYSGKAKMRAVGKFPTYAEFERLGFEYKAAA